MDLLDLVDAFVKSDESPPGLLGDIALGIESQEQTRWWRASFGAEVVTSFSNVVPPHSDAMLVLSQDDAISIVRNGTLGESQSAPRFSGDRRLLKRFFDRYLGATMRSAR